MWQHKLSLCAEHYIAWIHKQTRRAIHKYWMFPPDARVLVAVSGGKDSLALWDVLLALGYHADGVYIDVGITDSDPPDYSRRSRAAIAAFDARWPETRVHIVDIAAHYGASVPHIAAQRRRGSKRVCAICGLVKRHEMNRVAVEHGYDVLVTGHNLDDEAATLFNNVLHWQTGYLRRQAPVLPADAPGWVRKAKPFCRFYERETAAYAILCHIDYIYDECPYAHGATTLARKATLARLEHESPGAKLHFYTNFLRAKSEGMFADRASDAPALHPCSRCGQPTSATGLCAFCRLWEHVH